MHLSVTYICYEAVTGLIQLLQFCTHLWETEAFLDVKLPTLQYQPLEHRPGTLLWSPEALAAVQSHVEFVCRDEFGGITKTEYLPHGDSETPHVALHFKPTVQQSFRGTPKPGRQFLMLMLNVASTTQCICIYI